MGRQIRVLKAALREQELSVERQRKLGGTRMGNSTTDPSTDASVPTSTDTGVVETKASAVGGGTGATAPGADDNAAVNLHVRAGCRR